MEIESNLILKEARKIKARRHSNQLESVDEGGNIVVISDFRCLFTQKRKIKDDDFLNKIVEEEEEEEIINSCRILYCYLFDREFFMIESKIIIFRIVLYGRCVTHLEPVICFYSFNCYPCFRIGIKNPLDYPSSARRKPLWDLGFTLEDLINE